MDSTAPSSIFAAAGSDPKLFYFPIAARGELTRLVAAAGGLKLDNCTDKAEAGDLAEFGSPGSVPVLQHGEFKLSQSLAIENYISSIAPGFSDLTPLQRAKDLQFSAIKDDIMVELAKQLFGDKDPEQIQKALDKWFPVVEGMLPSDGFINGLSFPTMADLAVLLIVEGFMPYGAAYKIIGKPDYASSYARISALTARVKAVPAIATYLESSSTMKGNPFGF